MDMDSMSEDSSMRYACDFRELKLEDFEVLQQILEHRVLMDVTDSEQTDSTHQDGDSTSSSSSSDEDLSRCVVEVQAKPKAKRKYRKSAYRGPYAFPHLFKKDIRRDYAFMWMNVINMNDAKAFKSLLAYTTSKACAHVNEFTVPIQSLLPCLPSLHDTNSQERMIFHCAYKSVTIPDTICRMDACSIRRSREFQGAQLIISARYSGTILYDLVLPEQCMRDDSAVSFLPSIDTKVLSRYRQPKAQPCTVQVAGTWYMDMDPNHFVTKVLFVCTEWGTTPIKLPS